LHNSGGKSNALTVRDDAEFRTIIDQLQATKKTVVSVLVSFDMEHMEPYHSRVGNAIDPCLPGWSAGEMRPSTHVSYSIVIVIVQDSYAFEHNRSHVLTTTLPTLNFMAVL
jgi:hypothetical protein